MARNSFVFCRHVLVFHGTLNDTGEAEAIIGGTVGLAQVHIVFDDSDEEFEAGAAGDFPRIA